MKSVLALLVAQGRCQVQKRVEVDSSSNQACFTCCYLVH